MKIVLPMIKVSPKTKKASMYKGVYCKSLILVLQHNYTDLLGFSSGTHGAGFGSMLRAQIIKDAYEIIHSGSEQPEIFHLVGLFEENVGPDRLSDMVARIIYSDIVAYSKRIYRTLDISPETYPEYIFEDGIVVNPYKGIKLLLLPVELLHELPIARCWDDIDRVCRENDAIRAEINDIVGAE